MKVTLSLSGILPQFMQATSRSAANTECGHKSLGEDFAICEVSLAGYDTATLWVSGWRQNTPPALLTRGCGLGQLRPSAGKGVWLASIGTPFPALSNLSSDKIWGSSALLLCVRCCRHRAAVSAWLEFCWFQAFFFSIRALGWVLVLHKQNK